MNGKKFYLGFEQHVIKSIYLESNHISKIFTDYDICVLTPEAGDPDRVCMVRYFRWFYNIATKKCEQFIYGGCGGNENRFDTKDECEKRCVPGW